MRVPPQCFQVLRGWMTYYLLYYTACLLYLHTGTIPMDGTPVKVIITFDLWIVGFCYTLAVVGLIFTSLCFLFNIIFRKRRYAYWWFNELCRAVSLIQNCSSNKPKLELFHLIGNCFDLWHYLCIPYTYNRSASLQNQMLCKCPFYNFLTWLLLVHVGTDLDSNYWLHSGIWLNHC